jgi:hypothetical protein
MYHKSTWTFQPVLGPNQIGGRKGRNNQNNTAMKELWRGGVAQMVNFTDSWILVFIRSYCLLAPTGLLPSNLPCWIIQIQQSTMLTDKNKYTIHVLSQLQHIVFLCPFEEIKWLLLSLWHYRIIIIIIIITVIVLIIISSWSSWLWW